MRVGAVEHRQVNADTSAASGDVAGRVDRSWTNRPRGEVVARLAADLATLAQAGDIEGARVLHAVIEGLLGRP